MSYEMSSGIKHVGGRLINREGSHGDAEREYDRLRDLARQEADKRGECFERSKAAYERGDGAGAKQLSNEGKAHGAKMAEYNKQASDFIFRENNAESQSDELDLHGQFAEEAEDILEERIRAARAQGQTHLHVIVGKGKHSVGHVQRIKPRVEQVCRELGLQYRTEENEGRIYVNLQGGEPMPPQHGGGYGGPGYQQPHHHAGQQQYHGGQQEHYGGQQQQYHGGQQQHYGGQQQQNHGGQQQHYGGQQQDSGGDILKWIFRKLRKLLCS